MDRRYLAIAGLAFLVLFAGCADAGLSDDLGSNENETVPGQETGDEANDTGETNETEETEDAEKANESEETEDTEKANETEETERTEETAETNETDDAEGANETEETDGGEETTSEPWSEPEPPNTPLENNLAEEDESRMKTVEAVTDEGTDSAVQLKITANTTMPDIDPAEYGTVRGEPFFLVYLNGSITNDSEFSHANGTLVHRTEELDHEDEREFELTIPRQAFEAADAKEGEVDLMVLLMDEDKDWDDIYGLRTITVEYSSTE